MHKNNRKTYFSPIGQLVKIQKAISYGLLCLFLTFLVGCANYYEVNTVYDPYQIAGIQNAGDYIILHHGGNVWRITEINIDKESQELSGKLSEVDPDHMFYQRTQKPKGNRYYKDKKENPTHESHIYASEINRNENQVTISLSAIQKIDIYDQDVGATTASYILGAFGTVIGILGVFAIIVLATKSSCPYVYVNDGQEYRFVGEMYGGAIYGSLEREDYMPLPNFKPIDGNYELKIANQLLERQYTNLAELMLVEHPANVNVIVDKYGEIQTAIDLVAPFSAISSDGKDITQHITEKDSMRYLFQDAADDPSALSSTTLEFTKPIDATSGKLLLNATNSFWLDYLFGEFTKKFGTYLDDFIVKQRTSSPDKPIKWKLDQGIPLMVNLKTTEGWEAVDYFYVVGPLASRDLVMELDLSQVKGETIEVKLECGFMFWELDYAAMDYSYNSPVDIRHISAHSAIDEKGTDVLNEIIAVDDSYLYQPDVGNVALIKYEAPPLNKNKTQTLFLKSQGYYEYIRNYENKPEYAALKSFRKQGALIEFSKNHYAALMNNLLASQQDE